MTQRGEKDKSLRTPTILMDVRNTVIQAATKTLPAIKLCEYYRLVNSERATDRIQDAVRQLVEARKDPKKATQIAPRRLTLSDAIEDSQRYCSEKLFDAVASMQAASAIDQRITNYISVHMAMQAINNAAYGKGGMPPNVSPGR